MFRAPGPPRIARAVVALGMLGLSFAAAALPAGAGASSGSEPGASAIDPGLGVAGLIVLSCGIALLGLSRAGGRPGLPADAGRPAGAIPAAVLLAGQPQHRSPEAAAPGAIAAALNATAEALDAIARELGGPAAEAIATQTRQIREARITLAGDGARPGRRSRLP